MGPNTMTGGARAPESKNILSIQSHVAYGHVGNAAAVFPLQRLGHEVWPVHTVQFSNHTGYGAWRGEMFDARLIEECVHGMDERGALARCDGVLSGYIGAPQTGAAILRAVDRVKRRNPAALYCCDPVIGDVGRGVFVRRGVPEFFAREALALADVATPNLFELAYLTDMTVTTADDLRVALARLHARGPRIVLVTSVHLDDTPSDALDVAASSPSGVVRLRTPKLDLSVNGAGDVVAALFFAHVLTNADPRAALERAVSAVFGLLNRTQKSGERELALIAAQNEYGAPTQTFAAAPF